MLLILWSVVDFCIVGFTDDEWNSLHDMETTNMKQCIVCSYETAETYQNANNHM